MSNYRHCHTMNLRGRSGRAPRKGLPKKAVPFKHPPSSGCWGPCSINGQDDDEEEEDDDGANTDGISDLGRTGIVVNNSCNATEHWKPYKCSSPTVECPYATIGCSHRSTHTKIKQHMKDDLMYHNVLLMNELNQMKQDQQQLLQKMNDFLGSTHK